MKMMRLVLALLLGTVGGALASISLTSTNPFNLNYTDFDLVANPKADITSLPVSVSQAGGSYHVVPINGVATVASGSASAPAFSLTITNNTGATMTAFTLSGTAYQLKGNSSSASETLTASVSGITLDNPAVLDINTLGGAGVNNPPLEAPYSASVSGFSLADGDSFTITWTDSNSTATDAMLGFGNMSIQAQAVPEPGVVALFGLGAFVIVWRLRRRGSVGA